MAVVNINPPRSLSSPGISENPQIYQWQNVFTVQPSLQNQCVSRAEVQTCTNLPSIRTVLSFAFGESGQQESPQSFVVPTGEPHDASNLTGVFNEAHQALQPYISNNREASSYAAGQSSPPPRSSHSPEESHSIVPHRLSCQSHQHESAYAATDSSSDAQDCVSSGAEMTSRVNQALELFTYSQSTVRLGLHAPDNESRQIIRRYQQEKHLEERIQLRMQRDPSRQIYGLNDKRRTNNGKTGHCGLERERRGNHRDLFAETDLRLPDVILDMARENQQRWIDRPANVKIGKDTLHVAMLLLPDHDAMLIEEMSTERCEYLSTCEDLRRQNEKLSRKLATYQHQFGDLDKNTVAAAMNVEGASEQIPTNLLSRSVNRTTAQRARPRDPGYQLLQRKATPPRLYHRQESARRMSLDDDEDYDQHYQKPHASPSKRLRRATREPERLRGLPSPSPSAAGSYMPLVAEDICSSTDSCDEGQNRTAPYSA